MKRIEVRLGTASYPILVGAGLLGQAGDLLKETGCRDRAVVVTNPVVKGLHGVTLERGLAGFRVDILEVPDGEEYKSLETAMRLYRELTELKAERSTPLLALGGGVVGDLAGFVAATYLRGVPLIQVPTTLLAQVDSSIGGKVGVDYGSLKNRIGAFYQPRLVLADISTLKTLSPGLLAGGLAEVIKSAAIRNRELFAFLEEHLEDIKSRKEGLLQEVVFRTAKIKAEVVGLDERETGLRGILNFGHTVGHALETVSRFSLPHGEAVAVGMVVAARLSQRLGLLSGDEVNRLKSLMRRAGLPTRLPEVKIEDIMRAVEYDKKAAQGRVRFILLRSLGEALISDEVSPALLREVLTSHNEEA